jgi:exodeoxyribonuclease VII small subunit
MLRTSRAAVLARTGWLLLIHNASAPDCFASGAGNGRNMTPTPTRGNEPPPKGDFEKSLKRLEEVVKRMESPDLSLDDAMKLFEEGMQLSQDCQKQLEAAEGRVEILMKKADGTLQPQPFKTEDESS